MKWRQCRERDTARNSGEAAADRCIEKKRFSHDMESIRLPGVIISDSGETRSPPVS
jgi:hypothetical protein